MSLIRVATRMRHVSIILVQVIIVCTVTVAHSSAAGNSDLAADTLYEEAKKLADEAKKTKSPDNAVDLYAQAQSKLSSIINGYPSSSKAAKLVLGDQLQKNIYDGTKAAQKAI